MIEHIENSVEDACIDVSSLTDEVFKIEGMTGNKIRHTLNNLLYLSGVNYLEVGVWKGATFCSALYNNNINHAYAIDDWSEYSGSEEVFVNNCKKLGLTNWDCFSGDCFTFDLSNIKDKIDIFFYDGSHLYENQSRALKYFYPVLQEKFIYIVDDYDFDEVKKAVQEDITNCDLKTLYELEIQTQKRKDKDNWWNGLSIIYLHK